MTHRKVWWLCSKNPEHEWEASCAHRTQGGKGCPYCCGHKELRHESLGVLNPELAAEWHPTLNGTLTPFDVRADSWAEPWWGCSRGPDHFWKVSVRRRAQGIGNCPFCAARKASVTNSLASHCPDIAAQWHPTKNGLTLPRDVLVMDEREFWWMCESGHAWRCGVDERVMGGQPCPRCEKERNAEKVKRAKRSLAARRRAVG